MQFSFHEGSAGVYIPTSSSFHIHSLCLSWKLCYFTPSMYSASDQTPSPFLQATWLCFKCSPPLSLSCLNMPMAAGYSVFSLLAMVYDTNYTTTSSCSPNICFLASEPLISEPPSWNAFPSLFLFCRTNAKFHNRYPLCEASNWFPQTEVVLLSPGAILGWFFHPPVIKHLCVLVDWSVSQHIIMSGAVFRIHTIPLIPTYLLFFTKNLLDYNWFTMLC